jgi:hypothetical protein
MRWLLSISPPFFLLGARNLDRVISNDKSHFGCYMSLEYRKVFSPLWFSDLSDFPLTLR